MHTCVENWAASYCRLCNLHIAGRRWPHVSCGRGPIAATVVRRYRQRHIMAPKHRPSGGYFGAGCPMMRLCHGQGLQRMLLRGMAPCTCCRRVVTAAMSCWPRRCRALAAKALQVLQRLLELCARCGCDSCRLRGPVAICLQNMYLCIVSDFQETALQERGMILRTAERFSVRASRTMVYNITQACARDVAHQGAELRTCADGVTANVLGPGV